MRAVCQLAPGCLLVIQYKRSKEGKRLPAVRSVFGMLAGRARRKENVMNIHVHVDTMKAAEALSAICKNFHAEMTLRSEKYCIDPESTLGILAMMYSARDQMYLDTGTLEESELPAFLAAIDSYIVKEEPASPGSGASC